MIWHRRGGGGGFGLRWDTLLLWPFKTSFLVDSGHQGRKCCARKGTLSWRRTEALEMGVGRVRFAEGTDDHDQHVLHHPATHAPGQTSDFTCTPA